MISKQQFRKLKSLIAGGTTLKQAALQVSISDKLISADYLSNHSVFSVLDHSEMMVLAKYKN